jgi:SEA domain
VLQSNRQARKPSTHQSPGNERTKRSQVSVQSNIFFSFYENCFRSTTSKRPQPKTADSAAEYNEQKFSFTKSNKVKLPSRDAPERPVHQYRVNITHSEDEPKKFNDLSVKSLDSFRKEQSQEVDGDDLEYEEYVDEDDYGVILTEQDRLTKEKSTTKVTLQPLATATARATTQVPRVTTTLKPEDNTVIIFENFILPGKNDNKEDEEPEEDEGEEIEYEYIDEEEPTEKPTEKSIVPTAQPVEERLTTPDNLEVTTYRDANRIQAVVSVVTTKSVVNRTMPKPEEVTEVIETTTEEENYPKVTRAPLKKSTTEDYYVVASVQTSRSVSGAHFLPFEHVKQEEKIKSKNELATKKKLDESSIEEPESRSTQIPETENVSAEIQDDEDYHNSREVTTSLWNSEPTAPATTSKYAPLPSTESIIDKLDRVQSDLSLGVLSGEYPVLKDRTSKKSKQTTSTLAPEARDQLKPEGQEEEVEEEVVELKEVTTTVKPLVLIRKFSPKSTVTTTRKPTTTQKVIVKSSILPTTTEAIITTTPNNSVVDASQRSDKKISFDDIAQDDLAGLLPSGYKPRNSFKNKKLFTTTTETATSAKEETIKTRNSTDSRSYKAQPSAQSIPTVKGFKNKDKNSNAKPTEENETENVPKSFKKLFEASEDTVDINKLLPPGFKPSNDSEKLEVIPLEIDQLSKFLPPGFKLQASSTTEKPKIKIIDEDIGKFLPPGFKPAKEETKPDDVLSSILGKIKFQEAADLLPSDFKESVSETPVYQPATTENVPTSTKGSGKVVFPSRLGKKPGGGRMTTAKPNHAEGPRAPEFEIKRGPPTRATTEFTGWPTKATTPISIEKLLELQRNAMEINVSDLLPKSTTPEPTTTTTTTTTTTPRPTQPTVCRQECSLAATIRIIDGVEWSPELLTHHTDEYKNLAAELELELNEVYNNAPSLKQWFKKVRIDSFSKGSVLVDYFVELADIPKDINTLEIKKLFHAALAPVEQKAEAIVDEEEGLPQPIVREAFKLGNFMVDPISTDFIGNTIGLNYAKNQQDLTHFFCF